MSAVPSLSRTLENGVLLVFLSLSCIHWWLHLKNRVRMAVFRKQATNAGVDVGLRGAFSTAGEN